MSEKSASDTFLSAVITHSPCLQREASTGCDCAFHQDFPEVQTYALTLARGSRKLAYAQFLREEFEDFK